MYTQVSRFYLHSLQLSKHLSEPKKSTKNAKQPKMTRFQNLQKIFSKRDSAESGQTENALRQGKFFKLRLRLRLRLRLGLNFKLDRQTDAKK